MEVTREAIDHIESVEKNPTIFLGVKPSGCAGFEYRIELMKKSPPSSVDDCADVTSAYYYANGWHTVQKDSITFMIPKDQWMYFEKATLDLHIDGFNKFLKWVNPLEESACGCGESVTFYPK